MGNCGGCSHVGGAGLVGGADWVGSAGWVDDAGGRSLVAGTGGTGWMLTPSEDVGGGGPAGIEGASAIPCLEGVCGPCRC